MSIIKKPHSSFVRHEPCKNCNSKDNFARYSDGHGYCFGCQYYETGEGEEITYSKPKGVTGLLNELEYTELRTRRINEETCRKFGYAIGNYNNEKVQVANYYDASNNVVAQKIRTINKDFKCLGNAKSMDLWGMHLWSGSGKMVTVCEGEIDCLTVSQHAFGNKYPVVSVPNGAAGAARSIAKNVQWLEGYEKVIFLFDQDEAGKKAALECASLLSPGKGHIATLPLKDPNECLLNDKLQTVVQSIWNSKPYRPEGIVYGSELWDIVKQDEKIETVEYPWAELNNITMGCRIGEVVCLCAGTGVGKSQICREIAYKWINEDLKVGYIALEESVKKSAKGFMGMYLNVPPHLWEEHPDITVDKKREAYEAVLKNGDNERIGFYDHFGSMGTDKLLSKIREMVTYEGIRHIILDHISIVVSGISASDSGGSNERRLIDNVMTALRSMVEELGIALIVVSHLKRLEGNRGHEDADIQVSLSHLRGSGSISQLCDIVIAAERNLQSEVNVHQTQLRCIKNRYTGSTGPAGKLSYEPTTGRLSEFIEDAVGQNIGVDVPF
jgi:twinkle protein